MYNFNSYALLFAVSLKEIFILLFPPENDQN